MKKKRIEKNTVLKAMSPNLQLLSQPSCGNSPNCPDAQLVSHSSIHNDSEGSEFHKNILLNIWQGQDISANNRFYWHSTISQLRMREKKNFPQNYSCLVVTYTITFISADTW